jgi:hypothetical protein
VAPWRTSLAPPPPAIRRPGRPGPAAWRNTSKNTAAAAARTRARQVSTADRNQAKRLAYGVLYGMGPGRLAALLGIGEAAARQLQDEFMGSAPALKEWLEGVKKGLGPDQTHIQVGLQAGFGGLRRAQAADAPHTSLPCTPNLGSLLAAQLALPVPSLQRLPRRPTKPPTHRPPTHPPTHPLTHPPTTDNPLASGRPRLRCRTWLTLARYRPPPPPACPRALAGRFAPINGPHSVGRGPRRPRCPPTAPRGHVGQLPHNLPQHPPHAAEGPFPNTPKSLGGRPSRQAAQKPPRQQWPQAHRTWAAC